MRGSRRRVVPVVFYGGKLSDESLELVSFAMVAVGATAVSCSLVGVDSVHVLLLGLSVVAYCLRVPELRDWDP